MNPRLSHAAKTNMNVIRALSGIVVVFSHYVQLFVMPVAGRPPLVDLAIGVAEFAVLTFFVLSGLLIALSIRRNIQAHGCFDGREYLVSRVARIYPPLVASVVLCIVLYYRLLWIGQGRPLSLYRLTDVYPVSRTEFSLNWSDVLFTLLQTYAFGPGGYLSANGSLWSLSHEVGCYLAAGFAVIGYTRRGLRAAAGAGGLVALGCAAIRFGKIPFLHYGTIWTLGVVVLLLLDAPNPATAGGAAASRRFVRVALLLSLLGIINLALARFHPEAAFTRNYLISAVIAFVLFGANRTRRVMSEKLATFAASTYTLYLFHFPLMLSFYAVARDLHETSPAGYYVCTALLTVALIPLCHALAKALENRRFWESLLTRVIR